MFCSNCGNKLQDGQAFCANCGSNVMPEKVVQLQTTKPHLTIHNFIGSPYGAHLKKKYNMVCVLSVIAIILTVAYYMFSIVVFWNESSAASEYLSDSFRNKFMPAAVLICLILMTVCIALWVMVPKKLTHSSCILAIVFGFFSLSLLGIILGVLMFYYVKPIEKEYKKYLQA